MSKELNLALKLLPETIRNASKSGRLSKREQIEVINDALMGKTEKVIVSRLGMSMIDFDGILNANPGFRDIFEYAQRRGGDIIADTLLELPDSVVDEISYKKAHLMSTNIKWLLGKRVADKYGDRLEVKVEHIDLNEALNQARSRIIDIQKENEAIIEDIDPAEFRETHPIESLVQEPKKAAKKKLTKKIASKVVNSKAKNTIE